MKIAPEHPLLQRQDSLQILAQQIFKCLIRGQTVEFHLIQGDLIGCTIRQSDKEVSRATYAYSLAEFRYGPDVSLAHTVQDASDQLEEPE